MDNLAHKMLHTFEKMDSINPTFKLIQKTMKKLDQLYAHFTIAI